MASAAPEPHTTYRADETPTLHVEGPDSLIAIWHRSTRAPHQQHPDVVAAQVEEFLSSS